MSSEEYNYESKIKFGEQLKKLRQAHNWSLKEAAKHIGIGKSTLLDYEKDK